MALNITPADVLKTKKFCREEKSETDIQKNIVLSKVKFNKINMKKLGEFKSFCLSFAVLIVLKY